MGQNSCCTSGKYQKLLLNEDNKILDFIIGIEGVDKVKNFFQNTLKEQISTRFNRMPASPLRDRQFNQTMNKIDQDCKSELGKLDKMKNALTQLPGFKDLPVLQKDNLIILATKKFEIEIADRLKSYQEGIKGIYNVDKYMNFLN